MSYKLLVVDDEPFMLSYLKSCIPWDTIDVEIVDCAYNGEDAIRKTKLHHPDLIITDIVMPGMYGLEFIKNIYGQYKNTKIIILSGHQNFGFAREALLYGVVDYIVKPSLASDILAAAVKAITAIEQERTEEKNYQDILWDLKRSIPDITRSFLELLTADPVPDLPQQIAEKSSILNFPLDNRRFACFRILFDSVLPDSDGTVLTQEMEKVEKHLASLPCVDQILYAHSRFNTCIGLISLPYEDTRSVREFFTNTIRQFLPAHMHVVSCISLPFDRLENAFLAFKQIQHTLNSRVCSLRSHCYLCGDTMDTCDDVAPVFSSESYLTALRSLSAPECSRFIHTWIENCVQQKSSMYRLRRELRFLLKDLDTLLASLKTGLSPLLLELGLTEAALQQEESLIRLEKKLDLLSRKTIARLSDCEAVQYPPVIFLACQYIEEHYREKISVADLARQLYLTPNYLSSLFKKHTGSSLSEYITVCRIRKAKELMADSNDIKTYEIADLVGYNDYEHFRKVFKKYVGINPAKYRTDVILPR